MPLDADDAFGVEDGKWILGCIHDFSHIGRGVQLVITTPHRQLAPTGIKRGPCQRLTNGFILNRVCFVGYLI